MADRTKFEKDVKTVLDNDRESTAAFIRRLKTLSPSGFARLSASDLRRLTYAQYREVAQAILPDDPVRDPEVSEEPPEERRSVAEIWASLSVWRRSFVLMAAATVCSFATILAGPVAWDLANPPQPLTRSSQAYEWDHCHRLTLETDGCRYVPTQNLRWDYVAARLGMKTAALLDLNRHLPRQYAPAGQPIVIWRFVGKLEN